MNHLPPVSFIFPSNNPPEKLPSLLEDLAQAGARRVSLPVRHLIQSSDDLIYRDTLMRELKRNGLELFDVHAPHGMSDSFGCPVSGAEEHLIFIARKSLHAAADLGARTVTFHCSRTRLVKNLAPESGEIPDVDLPRAKERILHQLEILLPEAEKLGLMIALENLFLPSSTASFLMSVIREIPHPCLGLNYDSGHALLLENQPGKVSSDIAEWIRSGWQDDTVIFQPDQLDLMLSHIITVHLHDNSGKNDEHKMPGDGIANWPHIIERLRKAPRLISIQSEVDPPYYGDNPGKQVPRFQAIGFN